MGARVVACTCWVFTLLARGLACPPSREGGRVGNLATGTTPWIEAEGGGADAEKAPGYGAFSGFGTCGT